MSFSPPPRRLSTSSKREEDLINAYEAEEERIINILSRKLEQLREEKIHLETALEHESEAHVNRLTRELTALRRAQQQASPDAAPAPEPDALLDTLRRENEQLRARLADAEHAALRAARLNEVFRAELVEHRIRAGVPVDSLLALDGVPEPAPARRSAAYTLPPPSRPPSAIPIAIPPPPRPSSRIHRPAPADSASSASASPVVSPLVHTYASAGTDLTTPPSEGSLHATPPTPGGGGRLLTYPAAPPPSLSSSLGSPVVHTWDSGPGSPAVPLAGPSSPAGSRSQSRGRGRVVETGSLRPRRTAPAATAE